MTKEKGLEYFNELQTFYDDLLAHRATEDGRLQLIASSKELITYSRLKIEERKKEKGVDTRQTFNLEFMELLKQIVIITQRLNLEVLKFNTLKLKALVQEMESMLDCKPKPSWKQSVLNLKEKEIIRLLRKTFKVVFMTFAIGLVCNYILTQMGVLDLLAEEIKVLVGLEAGMAALIVFITSFNLSYTNQKRGKTDMELIHFMTKLNIYARRIKFIVQSHEPDIEKRKAIYEDVNYYFNCIGLKLVEGVDSSRNHSLKFDITILQCLDQIHSFIDDYMTEMEEVSKIRTREIQDAVIETLNDFQITATVRTPTVFSSLNDWLIRLTYFVLVAVAPVALLPRLLIINVFQRAFFNVAREVDDAIYSSSIAALPVENRVVRRLCRISSILNED